MNDTKQLPASLPKVRHKLSVMSIEGHAEIAWNVHDYDSITHAKRMFDDLVKKRYQAFSVVRDANGVEKGERVAKFDPALEEILMVPPVSGG